MGWNGIEGDRRLTSGAPRKWRFSWLTPARPPICFCLLPSGTTTRNFRRTFGRPTDWSWRFSETNWPRRSGVGTCAPVEMLNLRGGIFDEASISVIASDTIREIGRARGKRIRPAKISPEHRGSSAATQRLRGEQVGGRRPRVRRAGRRAVHQCHDVRCSLFDGQLGSRLGRSAPEMLKTIVVRIRPLREFMAPSFALAGWPLDRPSVLRSGGRKVMALDARIVTRPRFAGGK